MKRHKKKRWIVALCIVLFLVVSLIGTYGYCRMRFPLKYEVFLQEYAQEYQLDPYLVLAVIWAESSFRPEIHSRVGAMGLMQIMPSTGEWIAGKLGIEDFEAEMLLEPQTNIRIGCWYLHYLEQQFGKNEVKILAGYNAGPNNVKKWQQEWGEEYLPEAKDIPYPETEEYVKRVCNAKAIYKWLYQLD